MVTSSNGNIFRVTCHLCGEFTGHRWIPAQRPVTRSFDVLFDLRPNRWLSKQSWGCWFEMPSHPLWRHCNGLQPRHPIARRLYCVSPPTIRVSNAGASGPWFNIKILSYQYRKSHCGDKTILRPSYLHNGISYTDKTESLYWIGALVSVLPCIRINKRW